MSGKDLQTQVDRIHSDPRAAVLSRFELLTGVSGVAGLLQEGRETDTARFSLRLTSGRDVRLGGVDVLMSWRQFQRVLLVTLGVNMQPVKGADWLSAIGALVAHATEVTERPGERYQDTVLEWLLGYADRASSDKDGALHAGAPFWDDDERINVTAAELAKYVRREYSEQVRIIDLRQALNDLGFERVTLSYKKKVRGVAKVSSKSYYRAAIPESVVADAA